MNSDSDSSGFQVVPDVKEEGADDVVFIKTSSGKVVRVRSAQMRRAERIAEEKARALKSPVARQPPMVEDPFVRDADGKLPDAYAVNLDKRRARRRQAAADALADALQRPLPSSAPCSDVDDCSIPQSSSPLRPATSSGTAATPLPKSPTVIQLNMLRVALAKALCVVLEAAPRKLVLPLIESEPAPLSSTLSALRPLSPNSKLAAGEASAAPCKGAVGSNIVPSGPRTVAKKKGLGGVRVARSAAPDVVHAAARLATLVVEGEGDGGAVRSGRGASCGVAGHVDVHGVRLRVAEWVGKDSDAEFEIVVVRGECDYYAAVGGGAPSPWSGEGAAGVAVTDAERRLLRRAAAAAAVSEGRAVQVTRPCSGVLLRCARG